MLVFVTIAAGNTCVCFGNGSTVLFIDVSLFTCVITRNEKCHKEKKVKKMSYHK